LYSFARKIAARPYVDVFKELNKKDRRRLDKSILEYLGLANFQDELYSGISQLVRQRIQKSQSHKRTKKITSSFQ
jgi:hypothetical protein